ncbi:hypothetical protein C7S17_4797 [Burkholderia thailandensis]|nr:hypothetical protein [Burkholderia thailandensis]
MQSDLPRYRKFMKSPKVFRHPAAKRLNGLCLSPATGPGAAGDASAEPFHPIQ